MSRPVAIVALAVALAAVAGCAASASSSDPFTYCQSVGTIDAPDARYTGPPVPETIVQALMKAMNVSSTAPADQFAKSTSWRCMDGKVYACNVGANIPCSEKADISRTPSSEMASFCAANPNTDVVPAVVTGRATVYEWRCANGAPVVVRQVSEPDARGFIGRFWYQLSP